MAAKFNGDCVRDGLTRVARAASVFRLVATACFGGEGREGLLNRSARRDRLGKTLPYKIVLALACFLGVSCTAAFAQLPSAVGWTGLPVSTSLEGRGACPLINFGGVLFPFV